MSQDTSWIEQAGTFEADLRCYGVQKQWSHRLKAFTPVLDIDLEGEGSDTSFPVAIATAPGAGQHRLIVADNPASARFRFEFQASTPDRLHVRIHGTGELQGLQVSVDADGYLRLVQSDAGTEPMKLEPLEWTQDTVRCRIRDHLGHAVRVFYGNPSRLRVHEGDELTFVITRRTP